MHFPLAGDHSANFTPLGEGRRRSTQKGYIIMFARARENNRFPLRERKKTGERAEKAAIRRGQIYLRDSFSRL